MVYAHGGVLLKAEIGQSFSILWVLYRRILDILCAAFNAHFFLIS